VIDPETKPENLADWARRELLAIEHAKRIAGDVGWDVEDLTGLVTAALDAYALARCERGTCTHPGCDAVNAIVFADRPFTALATRAGLTFRLDEKGGLRAGPSASITDEWRLFIARNRDAIVSELRK
jgi:hypothetical protein